MVLPYLNCSWMFIPVCLWSSNITWPCAFYPCSMSMCIHMYVYVHMYVYDLQPSCLHLVVLSTCLIILHQLYIYISRVYTGVVHAYQFWRPIPWGPQSWNSHVPHIVTGHQWRRCQWWLSKLDEGTAEAQLPFGIPSSVTIPKLEVYNIGFPTLYTVRV